MNAPTFGYLGEQVTKRVSTPDMARDIRLGFCPECEDTNGNGGEPVHKHGRRYYCPNCDTWFVLAS